MDVPTQLEVLHEALLSSSWRNPTLGRYTSPDGIWCLNTQYRMGEATVYVSWGFRNSFGRIDQRHIADFDTLRYRGADVLTWVACNLAPCVSDTFIQGLEKVMAREAVDALGSA